MLREEEISREYNPIFKPPSRVSLREDDTERLIGAFFYHLKNNGGSLPNKFLFLVNNEIVQYTFSHCKSKLDRETLIIKPVYLGQILSEGNLA